MKRLKTLFAAILLSFSSLFAAACAGITSITGISMSSEEVIDVDFGKFSYDGIKVLVSYDDGKTSEINLTADMIPDVEKLKFFKMGEQTVKVVYLDSYTTTMKINVVLNEFSDVYDLVGYTCVYDGLPHEVKLNHELPEGATVVYPKGNLFTNAGTYNVTAVISKSGYASKELSATLTILENEHDEDGIVFEDKVVPFNGEVQSIEAQNVPEGVSVSYTIYDASRTSEQNKAYYAGTYCFVAHFTNADPNYKQIADKVAYLTIETVDYDISGIEFPDVIKAYDGELYTPTITNTESLPQGITVTCETLNDKGEVIKDNRAAGEYTLRATFSQGDVNHNPIAPMYAKLRVAKKVIPIKEDLVFNGEQLTFTGDALFVSDPTGLPDGVSFTLDPSSGFVYAGEYPIVATFTAASPNETVDYETATVYLVIQQATSSVRVYEGDDDKGNPIYHDLSLADIEFDGDTATIDTDYLRLSEDFEDIECGIEIDLENEPLTFFHIITDSTTGEESYEKTEPKDFAPGESYTFSAGFKLTSDDYIKEESLNESISLSPFAGRFTFGNVKTKSGGYEYEGSFNASNIYIDGSKNTRIVNVEPGVEAKSIQFFDPDTLEEVSASDLELDQVYKYEVSFYQKGSAVYVNETGSFIYKKAKAKDDYGQYTRSFSNNNLMITDGVPSVIDVESGANLETITFIESNSENATAVAATNFEYGKNYKYELFFTGIGETGSVPGTIWQKETGTFTYSRVKDLTTDTPITTRNITIENFEASINNINPEIVVNSIDFFVGTNNVPVTNLTVGETYSYIVTFRSSDVEVYNQETGTFTYDRVRDLTTNQPITATNISIEGNEDEILSASIANISSDISINYVKFYDIESEIEVPVDELIQGTRYKYVASFRSSSSRVFWNESGTVIYGGPVKVKGTGSSYDADFSLSNLVISRTLISESILSASVKDLDPTKGVRFVRFFNQSGNEVEVNDLEYGKKYSYRVVFNNDYSGDYVVSYRTEISDALFTYTRVLDTTTHEPITAANIKIDNGVASLVNIDSAITVSEIKFYAGMTEVPVSELRIGDIYTYAITFVNDDNNVDDDNKVYAQEVGAFTYDTVKDLTTNSTITAANISIEGNNASVVNINPDIEVNYLKFYKTGTTDEVAVTALVPGTTYDYAISFKSSETKVFAKAEGTFIYGGAVTVKGTGSSYDAPFSLSNLLITKTSVNNPNLIYRVIELNPDNSVYDIEFYDNTGKEVALKDLVFDQEYTYKVIFNNGVDGGTQNAIVYKTEVGTFTFKKLTNKDGGEFKTKDNLKIYGGVASLVDVETDVEDLSIEIYNKSSKTLVSDLNTLQNDYFYISRIILKSKVGCIWVEQTDEFIYPSGVITE